MAKFTRLRFNSLFVFMLVQPLSSAAEVAEKTPLASSSGFSSLMLQMLVALGFIVMLLFAFAWFVKRTGMLQGSLNGQLAVLGSVAVGQREKVVLLQVGQEQLVVGVTATEVSLLHLLADPIQLDKNEFGKAPRQQVNESFAQKLSQALQKRSAKESK